FYSRRHLWTLPSFPTRRSSDLELLQRFVEQCQGPRRRTFELDLAPRERRRAAIIGAGWKLLERELVSAGRERRCLAGAPARHRRSEEHTSELQSRSELVCRLLL